MSIPWLGSIASIGTSLVGGSLSSVLSALGMGTAVAGLGRELAVGNMAMQMAEQMQIQNMVTNMVTSQITGIANQQKMFMDAAAGIGSAYQSGSTSIYNAIYATNNELGRVLAKAGGH